MSRLIHPLPMRYMRGMANAVMKDRADIYRNDGYGWVMVGHQIPTLIHHLLTPPVSGDPSDANAANAEYVEVLVPARVPIRVGDRVMARGKRWTIGGGDFDETYGTHNRARAARPIAATPRVWLSIRRYDPSQSVWNVLPPQLVQIAWSKTQPDRIGGEALRQFGWVFAPEESPLDLDIQQGDTFFYGGYSMTIQWVPPDPTERREAVFQANVGEGV